MSKKVQQKGDFQLKDYLEICRRRIEANRLEIEKEGTVGKEISLLARDSIPNPPLRLASTIVANLESDLKLDPVSGYNFEFFLKPQGDRAAVMMRYAKI